MSNFPTVIYLLIGGLFSTFRGRTTMGDDKFCGQKPKVLIQLKKKEKETL